MDSAAVLNAETSLLPAQEVASAQEVAPRSLPRRIAGRANDLPPGAFAIVKNVEASGKYRLQLAVPFTTSASVAATGVFAVWVRTR